MATGLIGHHGVHVVSLVELEIKRRQDSVLVLHQLTVAKIVVLQTLTMQLRIA